MSTNCSQDDILVGAFPRYYGHLNVVVNGADSDSAKNCLTTLLSDIQTRGAAEMPTIDEFASLAKNAMMPSLSDGNSLLNFLFELRDFKYLGRGIIDRFWNRSPQTRIGVDGIIDTLWDAFGQKPWASRPQNMSSAYLSWKLAWQPFYNDCKALYQKIISIKRRIQEFERRANQPQQRYYGKTYEVDPIGGSYQSNWTDWSDYGMYALQRRTKKVETGTNKVRLTATMRYRYELPPELKSLDGALSAYLDVLGINGNPAIIWNAIPFSFVVDWFVNVGEFLESIRFDNVRPMTIISDFCVSQRSERNMMLAYQLGLRPDDTDNIVVFPEKGVLSRQVRYKREVLNTDATIGMMTTGRGLVGSRAAVLTALGVVNLPRAGKLRKGIYSGYHVRVR